ncbi:MAG: ribonuclease III [Ruminococcus sp.]|nr:ribonuclease III [Ruminococcus sp.]
MEHTEYVNLGQFETYIRYYFHDKHLLLEALSHSSYTNEKRKSRNSNERLEFLGDSVLSIVVSEFLFHKYPNLPEGELTKLRASMVCEKALHVFAQEIHLGEFLLLGKGEEHTGGRERSSILADAFEAVIAAIFLDGGMDAAKRHILRFIPENPEEEKPIGFRDYKTQLQEIIQKNPEEKVEYVLVDESGPDHDKAFQVEVCLNSNVIGKGVGHSKKVAEQLAAKEALLLMGYDQA